MADPPKIAPWLEPAALGGLLRSLRDARFRVDVRHYQRVLDVALAAVDARMALDDPARLRTLIAPIVCQSAIDQRRFVEHFDDWVERLGTNARSGPGDLSGETFLFRTLQSVETRSRQWLWVLTAGVILLAGLAWLSSAPRAPVPRIESSAPSISPSVPETSAPAPEVIRPPQEATELAAPPVTPRMRWWLWGAAVGALILSAIGVWLALWLLRGRRFLSREATTKRPTIQSLPIATPTAGLYDRRSLVRVAAACRVRVAEQGDELAIAETLDRTVRAGGWFSPVFGKRRRLPEYLALIQRDRGSDQRTALIDHLLTSLSKAGVWITRYYFEHDPRMCFPERWSEQPLALRELAGRYPDHRLLVFAETSVFADPVTGRLASWVSECLAWRDRAVMMPGVERRGALEQELSLQMTVLPATLDGLSSLLAGLNADQRPRQPPGGGTARAMPDAIAADPDGWIDRVEPEEADVERLLRSLKDALDPQELALVSACAVYPVMHWNLTLALGSALEKHLHAPVLTSRRLATITQLPWFTRGYMPNWLRRHLVDAIPRADGLVIRRTIDALLLSSLSGARGETALQIAHDASPAMSRLATSLRRVLEWNKEAPEALHDYVFRRFMVGRRSRKLAVRIPKALQKVFAPARSRRGTARAASADVFAMASWTSRPAPVRAHAAAIHAVPLAVIATVAAAWLRGEALTLPFVPVLLGTLSPLIGLISSSQFVKVQAVQATAMALVLGALTLVMEVVLLFERRTDEVVAGALFLSVLVMYVASAGRALRGRILIVPVVTQIAARTIFHRGVSRETLEEGMTSPIEVGLTVESAVDAGPFWLICVKALVGFPSAYAAVVEDEARLIQVLAVVALAGVLVATFAGSLGAPSEAIFWCVLTPLIVWGVGSLLAWFIARIAVLKIDADRLSLETNAASADVDEKRKISKAGPYRFVAALGLTFNTLNVSLPISLLVLVRTGNDNIEEFIGLMLPVVLGLLWMMVLSIIAVHAAIRPHSWARAFGIVVLWLLTVFGAFFAIGALAP